MPYLLFSEALLPAWRRGRPASPSRGAEADLGLGPRVRAWGGAGTARAPGERAREGRGPPAPGGGGRRDRKGLVRALGFRRVRMPRRQACACAHLRARVGTVVRTGGTVPRDAMWRPLPRASARLCVAGRRGCSGVGPSCAGLGRGAGAGIHRPSTLAGEVRPLKR